MLTASTATYTFPYTTLFRSRVAAAIGRELPGLGGLPRRDVRLGGDLPAVGAARAHRLPGPRSAHARNERPRPDRKSTRLNSSHVEISYAVFCLKKKISQDNY